MNIILASTSPRRQQLLSLAELDFVTQAVEIDETVETNELPQDYIVRMVGAKAKEACQSLINTLNQQQENNANDNHSLIITSDTIGVLSDGHSILVKPTDKADAFAMWSKMSANSHSVWTAVQLTVIDSTGQVLDAETVLEKTDVVFIELNEEAMEAYWATGEPKDKAGGYAIQGRGAAWVERINGSYTNVVGLPLAQTLAAIDRLQHKFNKR